MDGHSEGREELLQGEDGAAGRVMGAAPQHLEYSSEGGWSLREKRLPELSGKQAPGLFWSRGALSVLQVP